MCGIAGSLGPVPAAEAQVNAALSALKHRGPDDSGVSSLVVYGPGHLTLLHRRLRILDLDSRANQPMSWQGSRIVFNGEIYNYREVRRELEAEGVVFSTTSDTEVLLKGLVHAGWAILDRLEGMWAFAFYDSRADRLSLCRDRFGEKPLWFTQREDGFYFASEVRALSALAGVDPRPNLDLMRRFLALGYKSIHKGNASFFEDVFEVKPGTVVHIDSRLHLNTEWYWSLESNEAPEMSFVDAVDGTVERLTKAVDIRLRADVPLAFSLSGGIDSVILASFARKRLGADVHGFTIMNTDPRYEEREMVELAVQSLGIDHTWVPMNTGGFVERLADLSGGRNAPVLTLSSYVQALLMSEISTRGFKVVVGGSGADELFTGYYDHHLLHIASLASSEREEAIRNWQEHVKPIVRNPFLQDPFRFVQSPSFREHIYLNGELFNNLLVDPVELDFSEAPYGNSILRRRMLNELLHETVPVLMREEDENAMHWSIENRSPYLDRELAEFAFSIPTRHLVNDGFGKAVLRAAGRGIAPDAILDNRRKVGFNAPLHDLVETRNEKVLAELLSDSRVWEIVKRDEFAEWLSRGDDRNSVSKFLFSVLSIKSFLENNQWA